MHLRKILLLGLVALLIGSGSAYASLTGVIAGRITDVDDNPIPGVTVTATGPNLPGARVDVTSSTGLYRMPQLPPGMYTLTIELMGMKTIQRPDIRVLVGQTASINFVMEMAPFEETVVVTGAAEVLDTTSSSASTTIERDLSQRLPGSDDMFSAFTMSGNVTGGGNVRVGGGSFTDNTYMFDGVDTTDPVTSTFGANLSADAIEQVEVQTGGFKAEFGRSMGGIVNAVTKSGGNEFHGVFRWKRMDSDTRSGDKHEDKRPPLPESLRNEYAGTIDGPIIQDKLWFMATYSLSVTDGEGNTISRYGADQQDPGDYVFINKDREFHLPYFKLTFQPLQEHKLVLNYSGEDAEIKNLLGDSANTTPEAYGTQEQGGPFYSLEWTWLYSSNLFFVTRVGTSEGFINVVPADGDRDTPAFYDEYYQQNYNNYSPWLQDDRDRLQLSGNASYFIDDLMGAHEWKAGFEYHKMVRQVVDDMTGGADYTVRQEPVGDPDNPDYYIGTEATRLLRINPGTAEVSGDYYALYIQDDWFLTDDITLNLGLRYETVTYKNDAGDTDVPAWRWGQWTADSYLNPDGSYKNSAPMKLDNMIAPRIGFAWDVFGTGRTSINAFYGRFYNPFDLQLPGMFQPWEANQYATRSQEYVGPEWSDRDRDGVPDEDYFFDDANWTTTAEDEPDDWNLMDPDLSPEYTDEILIGIKQEVMPNVMVGFSYTNRRTRNMIEDVGLFFDEDGNVTWTYLGGIKDDFSGLDPNKKYDPREPRANQENPDYAKHLYWITNVEDARRDYYGYEFTARARRDNWNLQASYTYSRAQGTHINTHEGSGGVAQFSAGYDTWGVSQNMYGELPWSLRHYLKIAATYHFDVTDWYEMSFGLNGFFRSGYHYSKRMAPPFTYDPEDPDNDINDPSTWTARPVYRTYLGHFPEGRGTYELPSYKTWDISWQNSFKFGRYGALTVVLDVINVLNYQGILSEVDTFNPNNPDIFGSENAWGSPREYHIMLRYAF
jgi:outer membrane receptor protein involved in Fe transport